MVFLLLANVHRISLVVVLNIRWFSFGIALTISMRCVDIGSVRGLLPFAGWLIVSTLRSVSMSFHSSASASIVRAALSFSICRNVATRLLAVAISWSISASCGMNGSVSFLL